MIRNFLFHRVSPERDQLWDPMSVELFDKCIRYISKKYDVVQFEELVISDKYKKNNKKKIATIMFDDGYKYNIDFAGRIIHQGKINSLKEQIDLQALSTGSYFLQIEGKAIKVVKQ